MSEVMQSGARGRKHRCGACGAVFYDLQRELTACPKCETPYAASAHMPRGEPTRKRSWSKRGRRPEPEAAPEAPAAAPSEEEGVPILDAADDAEESEKGDESDEAAEDNEAAEDDGA